MSILNRIIQVPISYERVRGKESEKVKESETRRGKITEANSLA
jgi:hypothetical protein